MKITVIFDLISNCRHAAHTRHGFLRFLNLDEVLPNSGRHHAALSVKVAGACSPEHNITWRHKRFGAASPCYKLNAKRNSGFTLLELLMVIALLAVVMIASTTLISDESSGESLLQAKQDGTQPRWNQIRAAIIGDSTRTLNGQADVSGFVADMGRLPANIKELLVKDYDPDNDPITVNDVVQQVWGEVSLSSVAPGVTGSVWGGWRGPYLYTAGSQFFRDGWGNEDAIPASDALNYGWNVALSGVDPDYTDITVTSLGNDNAIGGTEFNADYPALAGQPLVNSSDWQMPTSSLAFNVMLNKEPTASQVGLELRIYYFVDPDVVEEVSTQFSHDVSPVGASIKSVTIDAPTPNLPIGKYAAIVMCTNGTPADKTDDTVYDGDCAAPNDKLPYYFTLQPRTSFITIPWNI